MTVHRLIVCISLVASSALHAGCAGEVDGGADSEAPETIDPGPGDTVGDEDTTFDHDNSGTDPFELLERIATEGPPRYAARMHGCSKIRYQTLGNVLRSLGVVIGDDAPLSASDLYQTGYSALGGPNYDARVRENIDITTSAASRLFDIFAAAAPEIIANLPDQPRCEGAELFDADGKCQASGVTCLLGVPATDAHLELCDLTVSRADTPELGQEIAVATLLAAAHTCE